MLIGRLLPLALGLAALGIGAAPVRAQQFRTLYGYTFNNPVSAQISTHLSNEIFWGTMQRRQLYRVVLKKKRGLTDAQLDAMSADEMQRLVDADRDRGGGAVGAQSVAAGAPPASRFKPTGARLFLPDMVKSLTQDAAQRGALTQVFEAGIKAYEVEAKKRGLVCDIAGSIAFLIGGAYTVYRDGEAPDDAGLETIARGLQQTLDTDGMRRAPAAEKQRFYELTLALGTYLLASREVAVQTKDADFAATLKTAAGDALKGLLKLDPARYRITANGLEPAG